MSAARPLRAALRSQEARNALVTQNYALAFWALKKIEHLPSVQRLGRDEAEAHAVDALIRAADLWDENYGVKFITYAVRAIRSRVFNAANKRYRRVVNDDGTEGRKYTEHLFADGVPDLLLNRHGEVEIPAKDDRDTDGLLDLPAALREIPDREYQVLMGRYQRGQTHRQIGESMGISHERARQLEEQGLARLRFIMTKGATA